MFCMKCGARLVENAAFCEQCGTKVVAENESYYKPAGDTNVYEPEKKPQTTVVSEIPVMQEESEGGYVYSDTYRPSMEQTEHRRFESVVNIVKRIGSSPLFLIGVIAFSLQLILAIMPRYLGSSGILGLIVRILNMINVEIPDELYHGLRVINSYGWGLRLFINILTNIPNMIVCIGLWCVFSAAKSRKYYGMKTGGLTTIKVVNIYQIVMSSISFAVAEIVLIVAIINGVRAYAYYYDYYTAAATAAIWFVVGIPVVGMLAFALVILYYAKVVKSINSVKEAIATDTVGRKASVFLAIWLIVVAVFQLFSIIVNPLSVIATVIYMICFSAVIFEYNRSIERLRVKE